MRKRELVPTAVAAVALGVTPGAVRLLIHRGRLTRYGTRARALVDMAEVRQLDEFRAAQRSIRCAT